MRDHIFISDLDGTLLDRSAMLPEQGKAILERLIDSGVAFTVASARGVASMRHALRGLRVALPVIAFNGAFISNLNTGRHIVVNAFEPEVAVGVFDLLAGAGATPLVSTFDGADDRVYFDCARNDGVVAYLSARRVAADPRMKQVADVRGRLGEQVTCQTAIGRHEVLAPLVPRLAEQFGARISMHMFNDGYNPGWFWLSIHDRRATKDQAVAALLAHCGLTGRPVTAFGDHVNDVALFRAATRAVAVAGAIESVRAMAHEVIGAAEDHAVPHYIAGVTGL